ncbi:MAG: hypothetical protein WDN04_06515 [Rhodospirillales bacterium]
MDSSGHERPVSNPVFEQFKVQLVETDANIQSIQRQIADATRRGKPPGSDRQGRARTRGAIHQPEPRL